MPVSHCYSTAVEGGAAVSVHFTIRGRMDARTYLAFVAERAGWFGISGWASAENGAVTVVASGPEAMVGALEMACTLGPLDALIDDLRAEHEPGPVPAGFRCRC
jgi:acylphosphatase